MKSEAKQCIFNRMLLHNSQTEDSQLKATHAPLVIVDNEDSRK